MARPRLGETKANNTPRAEREERRRSGERRRSQDRTARARSRADGRAGANRLHIRDLYKTDLDRHLWSWASPGGRKERARRKRARARRRRVVGLIASAAGMVGAAGLSYFLYRKLRKNDRPEEPVAAQADADEDLKEL